MAKPSRRRDRLADAADVEDAAPVEEADREEDAERGHDEGRRGGNRGVQVARTTRLRMTKPASLFMHHLLQENVALRT